MDIVDAFEDVERGDIGELGEGMEEKEGRNVRIAVSRIYRDRLHRNYAFERYSDTDFLLRFRLPKRGINIYYQRFNKTLTLSLVYAGAMDLIRRVRLQIRPLRARPEQTLSPEMLVLCTHHFFGNCAFQRDMGDLFGISQSGVSRVVKKTVPANAALSPNLIELPTQATDLLEQQHMFFVKAVIPGEHDCNIIIVSVHVNRAINIIYR